MPKVSTAKEVQNTGKRLRLNSPKIMDVTDSRLTCHLTFLQPVGALKSECQFAQLANPNVHAFKFDWYRQHKKPIIWRQG